MKIIITMAGEGKRFKHIGFDKPKYMIEIEGKSLFYYSLLSLRDLFEHEFLFITQKNHNSTEFILNECQKLGLDQFKVLEIIELTDGQATTAFFADPFITDSEAVIIYNIDTYVEEGNLLQNSISGDGFIPVFKSNESKWSFVKADCNGIISEVSEKEKISDLATIGFYYFRKWSFFKDSYEQSSEVVKARYREKYIAPLYNWMISNGLNVNYIEIDAKKVHVLGTPEDILQFYPRFIEQIKSK